MFSITILYAGLLGIIYAFISTLVIRGRRSLGVAMGHGGEPHLERLIRGHGNFAEYVPFLVGLMMLAEAQGASAWWLHVLGTLMVTGRLLHGWAFLRAGKKPVFRVGGTACTLSTLSLLGATCVVLGF